MDFINTLKDMSETTFIMVNSMKIGITGLPGSGKTAALRRVIQMLSGDGNLTVGGIIDEKVTDESGRKKIGMKVTDL